MKERHAVGWFEIYVEDLQRAKEFYEKVFDTKLENQSMGSAGEFALFPHANKDLPGAAGALFKDNSGKNKPSNKGTMVYFTAMSGDIKNELERVEKAGGKIIQDKTKIPGGDWGFMGIIEDTEGNHVAVHSTQG